MMDAQGLEINLYGNAVRELAMLWGSISTWTVQHYWAGDTVGSLLTQVHYDSQCKQVPV
jgi:hypothetical protein